MNWDDETIALLKKLNAKGLTFRQIGARLGCTHGSVAGKLSRLGIRKNTMPGNPFWTDDRIAEMHRLLAEGLSCSQVGQRLGCSKNAIIGAMSRWRDKAWSPSPPPPPPSHPLMSLKLSDCHWPIGDPKDPNFHFCGEQVRQGAYCPAHAAVAYYVPRELRELAE